MNAGLKKIGFDARDRVAIIHADDVGMCQATLPALADLLDFGLVSSASVMAPCPWFPAAAAFCRDHPAVDMGVHLTVNCEWAAYRWGPLSTRDPASGLLDAEGYLHARPRATWERADPAAVAAEIEAQMRRALEAGIDATHVDTHMGTVAHPRFLRAYARIAVDHRLPGFFLARPEERLRARGLGDEATIADAGRFVRELEAGGMPLFDDVAMLPLDDPADQVAAAKRIVDGLRPGLTLLILHPARDTPELRALAPDWRSRVANYEACLSRELREHVRRSGVQVIGYRPLREALRASP